MRNVNMESIAVDNSRKSIVFWFNDNALEILASKF